MIPHMHDLDAAPIVAFPSTAHLLRRLHYAEALHRCAQALLQPVVNQADQKRALTEALEPLRAAAGAGRAALFRNFDDAEMGFCSRMVAESCAPGIPSSLVAGFADRIAWSSVPAEHTRSLAAGAPVGGPVSVVFARTPRMRDGLLGDGILSVQFFSVYLDAEWWGYIGFDDYSSAREWGEEELLLQRTAVAMIGGALRRWRAEEQLQAAHDANIIFQERQRLARELHDVLTQSIYSIAIFARAGGDALDNHNLDKVRSVLAAVEETARKAQVEMRLLLSELSPPEILDGTLQGAIEARFDQVERRLGVHAVSMCRLESPLALPLRHALLRIALEALNNALRHAEARAVTVQIVEAGANVRMSIVDDGKGFDTTQRDSGMGLSTMRERAAAFGGSLQILSTPGAGTEVIVILAPSTPRLGK